MTWFGQHVGMSSGPPFIVEVVWREVGQTFTSQWPLAELLVWAEAAQAEVGDTARVRICDKGGTVVYDWIAEWWKPEEYRKKHAVPRPVT